MIDRRGFLIATGTAAALPVLPVKAETFVEEPLPDPWEVKLREIERHVELLRKNRATIMELETTIANESLRIDMQYLYSEIVDHCARVTLQLARESQWEARALTEASYVKKGKPDAAYWSAKPHPRDRPGY